MMGKEGRKEKKKKMKTLKEGLEGIVRRAGKETRRIVRGAVKGFGTRYPHLYIDLFPAIVDEQTGLLAKNYFEELLERQIKKMSGRGCQLCYALLDIDSFHEFNEEYGHQEGDRMIDLVARLLKENTRSSDHSLREDYVGRIDQYQSGRVGYGEEFGIIIPHTDLEGAKVMAERLRGRIERGEEGREGREGRGKEKRDERVGITVSIGIAQYRPGESKESLVRKADLALKRAKEEGKNRVVVYSG